MDDWVGSISRDVEEDEVRLEDEEAGKEAEVAAETAVVAAGALGNGKALRPLLPMVLPLPNVK
jgi:hypothetical protein